MTDERRRTGTAGDKLLRAAAAAAAALVLFLMAALFVGLGWHSALSLSKFGVGFLWSSEWNPVAGRYGALSSIYGTLVTTAVAMLVAIPASVLLAFFLAEIAPPAIAKPVGYAVELFAAVPSIIFGMWGLFVLAPIMSEHVQPFLGEAASFLPFFSGPPMGIGMLTAGLILSLMILPYMTSVIRDMFEMTPRSLKEAAYGMGATRWEVTRKVVLRHGAKAVAGAFFLGLGRAMGETMAVTFVVGNSHRISASLFEPANTIASTLANEFAEASDPLYLSALAELGLVLLVMTFGINLLARRMLDRFGAGSGGAR
ncbi:MAG: phosphate ABC transporter permease subunit PstC [Planctomycetota bacterium]|nr:MAG: phosphate ABC transporter permease subunit PstC [Planctomycetota bacterium]